MSAIHIIGGKKLEGSICLQGSKNAALPILAAALLTEGVCVLEHCPHIADVNEMLEILRDLGAKVWTDGEKLCIMAPEILNAHIDAKHIISMRSSIILLGVLLAENGFVSMEYPGGCVIGERPIDMHILGLQKMGCIFENDAKVLHAHVKRLQGAKIFLKFPSVGATENIILAAVKAKGATVICGAAKEPEIVHLCNFLNGCGAKIKGAGTNCIHIEGVSNLCGCRFTIPSDRIVAGTYLMSALATKGRISIENAPVAELEAVLCVLRKMGAGIEENDTVLTGILEGTLRAVDVETKVYPGFPTDLQSPMLVLLTQAGGCGSVQENIYENRFRIVSELEKMNAKIKLDGNKVLTYGVSNLTAAKVRAKELRGNAALIMAGLVAEGETVVEDCQYVKRGYEDICRDLKNLGAMIYENEEE